MLIDRIVRLILPRQDHFFALLEQIAERMTAAAAVFGELAAATGHEQLANISLRLKPIETEADQLCHRMFDELDQTFVTPIDREDLAGTDQGAGRRDRRHGALRRLRRPVPLRDAHRPDEAAGPHHRYRCHRAGAGRQSTAEVQRARLRPHDGSGRPHAGERGRRGVPAGHRTPVRRWNRCPRPGPPEGHALLPGGRASTSARTPWT